MEPKGGQLAEAQERDNAMGTVTNLGTKGGNARTQRPEEWKIVGSNLRKLSHELELRKAQAPGGYVRHEKEQPARVSERSMEANYGEAAYFLGSHNIKFWGDGNRAFCAYYVEAPEAGYDLHFSVLSDDKTEVVRVNNNPISAHDAHNYAPTFVAFDEGRTHRVVFVTSEHDISHGKVAPRAKELLVKAYSVGNLGALGITEEKHTKLRDGHLPAGLYSHPLDIVRDDKGDLVVVCKSRDSRSSPSEQAYVMWKLSGKDLSLIKTREGAGTMTSSYLFNRAGGNPKQGAPERLIVWGAEAGKLGFTYVGRYLDKNGQKYTMSYKAHSADVAYDTEGPISECLIKTRGCHITDPEIILSERDRIDFMSHVQIQDTRYALYVSEKGQSRGLSIAVHKGTIYKVFHNVLNFEMPLISLNVKRSVGDRVGIAAVERSGTVRMYELGLGQLIRGDQRCSAYYTSVDSNALNLREFIDIASGAPLAFDAQGMRLSYNTVSVVNGGGNSGGEIRLDVKKFEYPVRHSKVSGAKPEHAAPGKAHGGLVALGQSSSSTTTPAITIPSVRTTEGAPVPAGNARVSDTNTAKVDAFHGRYIPRPGGDAYGESGREGAHEMRKNPDNPSPLQGILHGGGDGNRRFTTRKIRGADDTKLRRNATDETDRHAKNSHWSLAAGDARHPGSGRGPSLQPELGSTKSAQNTGADTPMILGTAAGVAVLALIASFAVVFIRRYKRILEFRREIYRLDRDEHLNLREAGQFSFRISEGAVEQVYSSLRTCGDASANEL
ncbi:MAG: hypothetical protein ACTJLK_03885 [Anaplasma sp.]